MSGPTNGTGTIDFASDDENDTGREVDAATLVAAKVFNAVALPAGMPDFIKTEIEAKAAYAQKLEGSDAFTIGGAGGGSLDNLTREQRQKKTEDEAFEYLATVSEAAERQERREREWDASRVSIGRVTMYGEEWDQAFDLLSDPKLRDRLIETMTRTKGWSKDRAEKAADDALTLARIAQKKKDGTITAADEAKAEDITRRNPDAAEMVKEAARKKAERGYETDVGSSASAKSFLSEDMATAAAERQNLVKAAATETDISGGTAFASAPSLISHFDDARNATLAKPAAEPPKPIPPQLVAQIDMSGPF